MAYSFNEYVGDDRTTVFNITFPYLQRDHVYVTVDGVDFTFTFLDDYRVALATPAPMGRIIHIGRRTPIVASLVDFNDGSTIREIDLDTQATQLFFSYQEMYDRLEFQMAVDESGSWNAGGLPIRNIGLGTQPDDALTLAVYEGSLKPEILALKDQMVALKNETTAIRDSAYASVTQAGTQADRARDEADRAELEADRAWTEAERAKLEADRAEAVLENPVLADPQLVISAADRAETAAASAELSADIATAKASAAATSETNAANSASAAATSASNAASSASSAATSASTATTKANTATTKATEAANSATAAANSATAAAASEDTVAASAAAAATSATNAANSASAAATSASNAAASASAAASSATTATDEANKAKATADSLFANLARGVGGAVFEHVFKVHEPKFVLDFTRMAALPAGGSFARANPNTYVDEMGFLKTAPANTPRFTHDPTTLEPLGLLIEGDGANLMLKHDFTTWTKSNATVATDGTLAPDGASLAYKVTENTATSTHRIYATVPVTAGSDYTFSFWLKGDGSRNMGIYTEGGTTWWNVTSTLVVNPATGAIVSGNAGRYTVTPYRDGWYRVTLNGTAKATGNVNFLISMRSGTTTSYAGDGAASFYVAFPQFETGLVATSFIPSDGTTAVRYPDRLSFPLDPSWFDPNEGAFIVDFTPQYPLEAGSFFLAYSQSATSGRTTNAIRTIVYLDGFNFQSVRGPTVDCNMRWDMPLGQRRILAAAWKADDFATTVDGVPVQTDNAGVPPTGLTHLFMGDRYGGTIKYFAHFKPRIPNAALEKAALQ